MADNSERGFNETLIGLPDQAAHRKKTAKSTPADNSATGHRERLRARFKTNGHEALADYELLELLLFRSIKQADTKPLAKTLLNRFKTLASVFGASEAQLREVTGVGESVALDLKIIFAASQRMLKSEIAGKEILGSWQKVIEYCTQAMAFETQEQFRILFLDKKNALIADEVQQKGTIDHTPVYPREIVKRALELASTAIILVHNHPSGDPTPSRADIDMTKTIVETAKPLGILIHDHIVIGKHGHASLKGLGLM